MNNLKKLSLTIDTELANEQYNERKNKAKDDNPFKVASDIKPAKQEAEVKKSQTK